jgi:hypothetical protein
MGPAAPNRDLIASRDNIPNKDISPLLHMNDRFSVSAESISPIKQPIGYYGQSISVKNMLEKEYTPNLDSNLIKFDKRNSQPDEINQNGLAIDSQRNKSHNSGFLTDYIPGVLNVQGKQPGQQQNQVELPDLNLGQQPKPNISFKRIVKAPVQATKVL